MLELEGLPHRGRIASAELPEDGYLRFSNIPYGDYRLRIVDGIGVRVHEEVIVVGQQSLPIFVRLPKEPVQRSLPGTVSVSQLQHPVRKKAWQAFAASNKFFDAGDFDRAAVELRKALQISPGYAEAYGNLAVLHIRIGLYEQALGDIAHALEIAGPNARYLSDKALAEYRLGRYAESMQSARLALHLDPHCNPAHYMLGVVLAVDPHTMAESVPHLELAAQTIASAKAILTVVRKALGRE